jgi:two-component system response regulator
VLLVEDDPDRVRLTEHAVETAPSTCRLTTAQTAADALAVLEQTPSREGFDLVLLDLDLPDRQGHELCREMRTHVDRSEVPIVVLTSSDDREDVRDSYRVGANSHVTKAVDFQRFREDLEGILSYWLDVNRTVPTSSL